MKYTLSKITKVTPKPFKGDDGEEIYYAWIKAEFDDGTTREYGTKRDDYVVGESDEEIELEKSERADGKGFRFKEII